ncbi:hypothetical protein LTR95_008645 [Oleoguttula sp. CCFEE 5521]
MALKTYVLPPNLTTHPGGLFTVGTIIADPLRPSKPLSVPSQPLDVAVHRELDREVERSSTKGISTSVWAQFLQVASANLSGEISSEVRSSYVVDCLETISLLEDPSDEYAESRASEPKVKAAMNSGVLGRQPVYMFTGLKIAKGFRWSSTQGRKVEGKAGVSVPVTDQVTAGAELGAGRGTENRDSSRTEDDIIFAYQLHVIADKGWRKKKSTAELYVPKVGFLGKKYALEKVVVDAALITADDLSDFAEESEEVVNIVEANDGDVVCRCVFLVA